MNRTKNVFDWGKEINQFKTPINSFSNEDWDKNWNSFVMHRLVSMNPKYIELANEIQSLPPTSKKEIYSIYKEFIPKNKEWHSYIKSKSKEYNKELVIEIKDYFKCSIKEAKEYIDLLDKQEIIIILNNKGIDNKDIKKLTK